MIGRAAQVACGGIPGLAYLTLSRDILMEPAAAARLRRTAGFARPVAPAAPEAAIDDLAAQLARAERPLLLTSRSGRAPGAPAALRRLAELAAIPVFGRAEAVNLVTTSPMSVRSARQGADLLRAADLVLIVDTDVPWIPRNIQPSPDAVIVQIDRDPVKADMPLWTFPVGLSLTAEPALALHQLADALESRHGDESGRWSRRRDELAPAIAQATNSVRAAAAAPGVAPTDIRAVFTAINEAIDGSCLIVDEAVSNTGRMSELIDRPEAETIFSAGGPGLGWAPGASVGIKLARPDRDVLVVIGDGAFMFAVPTAALTLASEAGAPVVMLVLNNSGYRASRLPVGALYPEGSAVAADHPVWTRFRRAPDFAALAEACGACGWRTEGAEGLGDALADAFAATRDGVSAIIDVRVDQ